MEWAKRGPLRLVSGMESAALLGAVVAVAWGSWMTGQHPRRLAWGIVMAISGEESILWPLPLPIHMDLLERNIPYTS